MIFFKNKTIMEKKNYIKKIKNTYKMGIKG